MHANDHQHCELTIEQTPAQLRDEDMWIDTVQYCVLESFKYIHTISKLKLTFADPRQLQKKITRNSRNPFHCREQTQN